MNEDPAGVDANCVSEHARPVGLFLNGPDTWLFARP